MSSSDKAKTTRDLFQVILSNGFPRLRICMAAGLDTLELNEAWRNSPSLRLLFVEKQAPLVDEHCCSVCPNLRPLKSHSAAISLSYNSFRHKRICYEIIKLKKWESEKKFILEHGSTSGMEKSAQNSNETHIIYGRIYQKKNHTASLRFLSKLNFHQSIHSGCLK